MQLKHDSDLATYELSDREKLDGHTLSTLQEAVLQNERVDVIRQLAYLSPVSLSEEGKETYWQQEAFLRGQLSILTHLLEASSQLKQNSEGN